MESWEAMYQSMVDTFIEVSSAFDHQKLISSHISDLLSLPQSVSLMFKQGAFVVTICGRPWHSVGLDEVSFEEILILLPLIVCLILERFVFLYIQVLLFDMSDILLFGLCNMDLV